MCELGLLFGHKLSHLDGRWNSHWLIAHYAQNTSMGFSPTHFRFASGAFIRRHNRNNFIEAPTYFCFAPKRMCFRPSK